MMLPEQQGKMPKQPPGGSGAEQVCRCRYVGGSSGSGGTGGGGNMMPTVRATVHAPLRKQHANACSTRSLSLV